MLVEAILVHGVIGYKFCWLLPSEDQNQGIPAGHEITKLCGLEKKYGHTTHFRGAKVGNSRGEGQSS